MFRDQDYFCGHHASWASWDERATVGVHVPGRLCRNVTIRGTWQVLKDRAVMVATTDSRSATLRAGYLEASTAGSVIPGMATIFRAMTLAQLLFLDRI